MKTEFDNVNAAVAAIAAREAEKEKEKAEYLKKMAKSGENLQGACPLTKTTATRIWELWRRSAEKAATTSGGPDKTLMGDYQELLKITKSLIMELTEDTRTSAIMCADGLVMALCGSCVLLRATALAMHRLRPLLTLCGLLWTTI